ncbi:ATP-binding cassette domain-containing protein [Spongiactinospora sp. TRM90649]|uniref:ABC transporter ATP-binding protein n=1 Tax=Spongiactinospora sp. TRM90649 TaxID=3031114 RepID=UPI0023F6AAB2|nr:ATP-binding cassette domain-containing protein [Spongiactinospora sp. TRM90649]MDF5752371.1 ATP-binding cassette domain-containing protein [Spongiactinospora sp. TRM90649]
MPGIGTPMLEFSGVELSVAGVRALDGVTFQVRPAELFAIVGPDGSGKTSVIDVASGARRPHRGGVVFLGRDVLTRGPDEIAAMGMARIPAEEGLFGNLTVLDNLALGRLRHFRYGVLSAILWLGRARSREPAVHARAEDTIDLLGLAAWREHPVRLLPYGVRRRVELGRALATEPRMLLLDDPTAGLNREETDDLARFVQRVRDELGVAVVLADHDIGPLTGLADRVLALDSGRRVALGTPSQVRRDPRVLRAYLAEAGRRGGGRSN